MYNCFIKNIHIIWHYETLLFNVTTYSFQSVCTAIAAFLHYFFLAVFFIMLGEGIQIFIFVQYVFHVKRYRETYILMAMGWGKFLPAMF